MLGVYFFLFFFLEYYNELYQNIVITSIVVATFAALRLDSSARRYYQAQSA